LSDRPTPAQAAAHIIRIQDGSSSFAGFVSAMHHVHGMPQDLSTYPKFERDLMQLLDNIERGNEKRVLLCMPPRTCKSTFATQLLPAYFMGRNSRRLTISASYNAELAKDFGKKVKNLVTDPIFQQIFPTFGMSRDSTSNVLWNSTEGGQYSAIGIGGTATGRGANLLVLDDPIKNRKEANSLTMRNFVWNEFIDSLHSRLEQEKTADGLGESGRIIIVLTRWHVDDIAARIQASEYWKEEGWKYVEIKAIENTESQIITSRANLPKDDPRYLPGQELQKLGSSSRSVKIKNEQSFWPERFPLPSLELKRKENPQSFASLFQQSPYIEGGNIIKDEYWKFFKPDPNSPVGGPQDITISTIIISWDTSFSVKTTADPSVAQTWALADNGDIYLLDQWKQRVDFPDLKTAAIGLNNRYRGKGLIGHYIEDRASGQSLVQELQKESGFSVIPKQVSHDKITRLHTVLGLIQGGRVYLPEDADFLDEFTDECRSFPDTTHDDQVDCMTLALDVLSKHTLSSHAAFSQPLTQLASNQLNQSANHAMPLTKSLNSFSGWGE